MYQHKTSPCRRCSKTARPKIDSEVLGRTNRVGAYFADWLERAAVSKVLKNDLAWLCNDGIVSKSPRFTRTQ